MKCVLCRQAGTGPGEVTVMLQRGETTVLIKAVPAEVANQESNKARNPPRCREFVRRQHYESA